ncbi:MmcQ/YjbR family DNA-binding protein [Reyranella sp.]|uniref:MmcQ/YjbR family DNA-binding protein n=1 Tax=Reyranella sp. TaxID=1929291 RepID=UPI003D12ECF2
MTPKQIDRFCASLPAATRIVQWEGVIVFKVGGKMFCLIAPEDHSIGRISFKSAPEHYDALSRSPGFRPAPYLARAKWVSVDDPKALTDAEMKAYVRRAHAVIAAALSKKKRKELGLAPTQARFKPFRTASVPLAHAHERAGRSRSGRA